MLASQRTVTRETRSIAGPAAWLAVAAVVLAAAVVLDRVPADATRATAFFMAIGLVVLLNAMRISGRLIAARRLRTPSPQ